MQHQEPQDKVYEKRNPQAYPGQNGNQQAISEHKNTLMPAYLFWKLQCHLIKLAHRLRRQNFKRRRNL